MNYLSFFRALSVSFSGIAIGLGLFLIPKTALTNSHNNQQKNANVTFIIVNNYKQPLCLQGKTTSTPICVGAHQSRSIAEPNAFMLETAYFYTKPGLVHYWFGQNKAGLRKMLVASGEYEVHINVASDGRITHRGLHVKAGTDLASYISWHGLKSLLQA